MFGAATLAAVVIAASVITSTAGSTQRSTQPLKLAADYHVFSPVPDHPGVFYVVGPSSGRSPAKCSRLPHITVETTKPTNRHTAFVLVLHHAPGYSFPPGLEKGTPAPAHAHNPFPPLLSLPSGRYSLFTCHTG
jgi:hypothetical protein